jgi:hypothetical protein
MERRTGKDQVSPFFPQPAGGTEKHPDGKGQFSEIVSAILNTAKIEGDKKEAEWWQEVFVPGQLIPFATLYVDGQDLSEGEIAELLYRVRNFFPSERVIQPAPEDLRLTIRLCWLMPKRCGSFSRWKVALSSPLTLQRQTFSAVNFPSICAGNTFCSFS